MQHLKSVSYKKINTRTSSDAMQLTLIYHPWKTFYCLAPRPLMAHCAARINHKVTKSPAVVLTLVHANNGTIPLSKWEHPLGLTHYHTLTVYQPCIVYADDIVLLSCSCHGIHRFVDICVKYGELWDLQLNTRKTQCITFGGSNVKTFNVTLKNDKLELV